MQPVSDIFLGWATAPTGRQFYVRQLHDAKIKPITYTPAGERLLSPARRCEVAPYSELTNKFAALELRLGGTEAMRQCRRGAASHTIGPLQAGTLGLI
jgi:Uncharacterized protein conserved in bacteria (DUF2252)